MKMTTRVYLKIQHNKIKALQYSAFLQSKCWLISIYSNIMNKRMHKSGYTKITQLSRKILVIG